MWKGGRLPFIPITSLLFFVMSNEANRSPRQTRHLSLVAEFSIDIQHVAGSSNVVADTLSRGFFALALTRCFPTQLQQ